MNRADSWRSEAEDAEDTVCGGDGVDIVGISGNLTVHGRCVAKDW